MKKFWAFLLMGMLALAFVTNVAAQGSETEEEAGEENKKRADDDEEEDEEELLLIPHRDVSVSYYFPDAPNRKLKLGENINLLLGFHNKADEAFNITGIGAHLQSPFDLSYYIQNFTARRVVGAPVGPGQQAAAEYQFRPDPTLEPVEYWFSAWVIYNNSNDQVYMHYFYNGTIELVEENAGFGSKQVLSYLLIVAGLGLAGYMFLRSSGFQKRSRSRVERGTRSDASSDINDLVYRPSATSRPVGKRAAPKKSPANKKRADSTSGGESAEE
jgi:hypothetical protein